MSEPRKPIPEIKQDIVKVLYSAHIALPLRDLVATEGQNCPGAATTFNLGIIEQVAKEAICVLVER